ncbi:hypothetical protein BCON_0040g00430 [Botryotinia convoluta]|uniref:Uncharacterized protein n=1 Tax=Botryotinia convoluta TaxID=54673 RepID=A0A4Z1IL34_9HELO|nr:hypothetical protein BCON_0040g00430 [Botryotinia convoluta]
MNSNIQDFIDACHTIQIPVPTFYRVPTHNNAPFILQVTVLGHRIRLQNSEISYHAAKVQLARHSMHYLQGARNPAPALALGPGPVPNNVPSAHDQSHLELYFRRQIISQIGSSTRVQASVAADLMADIILRRSEGHITEWHDVMRVFTQRLVQRLNEGSS